MHRAKVERPPSFPMKDESHDENKQAERPECHQSYTISRVRLDSLQESEQGAPQELPTS